MTRFLITGRGAGKTSAAAQWVRGGVRRQLVLPDERQVEWVLRNHFPRATDLHPDAVITYGQLMSGRMIGSRFNELAIDNLDMMLGQLFPFHVGLITATGELATPTANTISTGGSS